jgi:acyl-[acyl-carrier-protein]-phospholipid O-acyltransferase/long-chain-fatty-acid--[acyl-carrier-protein] ligase
MIGLLADRRFGPFFASNALGVFSNNLFQSGLVFAIVFRILAEDAAEGAALAALAGGIFALPHVIAGSLAGQLADRFDKARLNRIIKGANVPLMAAAALALTGDSIVLLMTILFLAGIRGTLSGPIKYAILPDHLERRELLAATGWIQASGSVMALAGRMLGALLPVALLSPLLLAVAAGSFAASLFVPSAPAAKPGLKVDWNIFAGIRNITISAMRRERVRNAILGITWFFVIGAAFTSQIAPLARNAIGASEAVGALFLGIFSIGAALGALAAQRLLKGEISARLVPLASLGVALSCADLWLATLPFVPGAGAVGPAAFVSHPPGWRLLLDLLALSFSASLFVVPLYAILQTAGEPEERARDVAANNIVNAVAVMAGAGLVGLLVRSGVPSAGVFLFFGLATLAVGASVWRCRKAAAAG